jgi:hypothetical protein
MDGTLYGTVRQFLRSQSTLTLSTVGPDELPAAADLYFAADRQLVLYFISEADSRHARNLAHNPRVAATIHAQAWDWREIRGVQVEGVCQALTSPAGRARALALYGRKFSFLGAFAAVLTRHVVYQITPHWVRWLDNREAFGHKEELILNPLPQDDLSND